MIKVKKVLKGGVGKFYITNYIDEEEMGNMKDLCMNLASVGLALDDEDLVEEALTYNFNGPVDYDKLTKMLDYASLHKEVVYKIVREDDENE